MEKSNFNKGLLTTGFVFALTATQLASAATISSSLGNTASGFNDGDTPAAFLLSSIQGGQATPFDQSYGADSIGGNFSGSWTFNYGAIADTILNATLTIGILDHDSAASGSQLSSFTLDGNDLIGDLNTEFEGSGGGDGEYNEYTINLNSSLFSELADGMSNVSLALAGPGLETCTLAFACPGETLPHVSETTFNGANLIFSTLNIETQDTPPPNPMPEPGSLLLTGLGILSLRKIYRCQIA